MKQDRTFREIWQLGWLRLKSVALTLLWAYPDVLTKLLHTYPQVRKERMALSQQNWQGEAWRYTRLPLKKRPAFIIVTQTYLTGAHHFVFQLAKALALLGYHVIIPDIQQDNYLKNSTAVGRELEGWIKSVCRLPYINTRKVGLISAYFASLPLLRVLKQPSVSAEISTFLMLAPAANLRALTHFAFQGKFKAENRWHFHPPDPELRLALVKNFGRLPRKIKPLISEFLNSPRSWVLQHVRSLSEDYQKALVSLLQGSASAQHYEIELKKTLSHPERSAGPVRTKRPVFLIHGIHNSLIPFGESLSLSRSIKSRGGVHYHLSAILYPDHIMPLLRNPARWMKGMAALSHTFYRCLACLYSAKNLPHNRGKVPLRFKI